MRASDPDMIDPDVPVATIVLDHSECALVFDRHRIDYCCKGSRPLREAARDAGVALDALVEELELAIVRRTVDTRDPRSLSTRDLITQVIGRHHRYLHRTLPFLRGLAAKVARAHGSRDPTLVEVDRLVDELVGELTEHLAQEEREVFPAMLTDPAPPGPAAALAGVLADHIRIGDLLGQIRSATADYRLPAWACPTYRTLMAELEALETDTLRHLHLENHVLLPRFAGTGR
jgi:regulator of cell morphogenesis and NO signaling